MTNPSALVARLERVLERAIGDSFSVEGEFACSQAEMDECRQERDDTNATIRETIVALRLLEEERGAAAEERDAAIRELEEVAEDRHLAALAAPPVPEGDTQQIRAWLDEHMPDCRPITLAQRVINELSDYERFLEDASVVYDHITHGAISKPNTTARSVISVADDVVTGLVEEEIASRWQAFRAQIEGLRWVRGLPEGCREAGDGWLAALDAVLDAMKGVRRAAPAVWEKP